MLGHSKRQKQALLEDSLIGEVLVVDKPGLTHLLLVSLQNTARLCGHVHLSYCLWSLQTLQTEPRDHPL